MLEWRLDDSLLPFRHPVSRILLIALVATSVQQMFATLAKAVVPIIAPAALPDLGVSAAYVGMFSSLSAFFQIFTMIGCGSFIRRYGGMGVSQVGLVLMTIGLAIAASGYVWPFVITAFLLTAGTSVATPASSHILARFATPKQAPLIFSAKQTAVPFGLMVSGVVLPYFVDQFGWQGAMLASAAMCGAFALVLEPTRAGLDDDRDRTYPLTTKGTKETIVAVMSSSGLRLLAITMFAFVGLQTCYTTFFILFLTDSLHYSLAAAGGVFAMATLISMPARILWGYVATKWSTARHVLAGLGFIMAASSALTGLYEPDWPSWQILIVAVLISSTALGWHGVLLSEVARLSPRGQVGGITGGVLAVSAMGQVVVPLMFSGTLTLTGSYTYGFFAAAALPLLIAIILLAGGRRELGA